MRQFFPLLIALLASACAPSEDLREGQPVAPSSVNVEGTAVEGWPPEGRPAAGPTMPAATAPGTPGLAGSRAGLPDFTVPEGWQQEPPASNMRLAQWSANGGLECALFSFPGGGDVRANITRWVRQFEQPDGTSSLERAETMQTTLEGVTTTLVRVQGTFLQQDPPMTGQVVRQPEWDLFGVVFETTPDPYFLKCVGPSTAVEAEAERLTAFMQSFRFDA